MTRTPSVFAALACLPSLVMAQSLTLQAVQAVPLTAQIGAASQTSTVPAGPLAAVGQVAANAATFGGATGVELAWQSYAASSALSVEITARCDAVGFVVGQSTAPTSDFLVSLAAPFAGAAQVVLEKDAAGVSWAQVPVTRIDVGNDGSEELTEQLVGNPPPVPITLGPVPVLVRCTLGAQLNGPGSVLGRVRLRIVPRDTLVAPWGNGCGGIGLALAPRFDGGLESVYQPTSLELGVRVYGLAAQPLPLGAIQGFPCLLLPRPDLVVLAAPWSQEVLPIPAAARPLTLFVQAVALAPEGLAVSPSSLVFAF